MSSAEEQSSRWLVSTQWLAARLGAPDLVVVDGSYYIPNTGRDAAAEYLAGHIAGAVRFDIEAIADLAAKRFGSRQHVGKGVRVIGDRLHVEADGARDVAAEIFGRRVASGVRDIVGAVDHHEVGRADPRGEPLR